MLIRINAALALTWLMAATLCAADDPFCGKWKLNQEKSKIAGEQMKIADLGDDKYKFTFGNVSDTITADGTDQPTHFGRTTSITKEGPNTWKMVIKKDGKVISSMDHILSDDGKVQTIKGTDTKPDGTSSDFEVVAKRVGTGSGFAGTWESTDVKIKSPNEWEIEPYGANGLTFNTPAYKDTLSMNFDGKDYTEKGPDVAAGSTSSGKRIDANTLEVTDKIKGQVMDHTRFQVSSDGKTLTLTIHETGQPHAVTIVYDKI
ncbi:MAG: hypothetical protein JO033_23435 [Acidobacteriaceae bacterium]|nr:hypothetical protein [Acidobacteriaceae bacterium]MBV9498907.1 hypothetical protein [Acidobacteriaceae bacterium]